ncbi:hypothetical protein [Sinomicrobium soli]|uniref:hypothetical protein n=1 Tax=Sinomicrobium sp. N-1-3-6 TaxID=2219864 RepID=UPI0013753926|nr:hypothetical protein [Sinomicrobium sp. N-1-3-6]
MYLEHANTKELTARELIETTGGNGGPVPYQLDFNAFVEAWIASFPEAPSNR